MGWEGHRPKAHAHSLTSHTRARLVSRSWAARPGSMSACVMVGFGDLSLSHGGAYAAPGLLVSGVEASRRLHTVMPFKLTRAAGVATPAFS